jgi:hypothetical protein
MKKLILGLTALALLVSAVPAGAYPDRVNARLDQKGQPVDPRYGGYSHMRNSSTGEMGVCSGRCLLAGVMLGTAPNGSPVQLVLRNTSVANASGAIIARIPLVSVNTQPGLNPIGLPILLDKGITATLTSASNGEEVTVLFLDLDNP